MKPQTSGGEGVRISLIVNFEVCGFTFKVLFQFKILMLDKKKKHAAPTQTRRRLNFECAENACSETRCEVIPIVTTTLPQLVI